MKKRVKRDARGNVNAELRKTVREHPDFGNALDNRGLMRRAY
jgi:hypothetical protein